MGCKRSQCRNETARPRRDKGRTRTRNFLKGTSFSLIVYCRYFTAVYIRMYKSTDESVMTYHTKNPRLRRSKNKTTKVQNATKLQSRLRLFLSHFCSSPVFGSLYYSVYTFFLANKKGRNDGGGEVASSARAAI